MHLVFKEQDEQVVDGKQYKHPVVQVLTMFFAESLCIILYGFRKYGCVSKRFQKIDVAEEELARGLGTIDSFTSFLMDWPFPSRFEN